MYMFHSTVFPLKTALIVGWLLPYEEAMPSHKDFPQYREVLTIHLLKYLTSYHKIYSYIVTTYLPLRLLRDYHFKNAFYSIEEFLSASHNNVDTGTFIFNLYYYHHHHYRRHRCFIIIIIIIIIIIVCVYDLFFPIYHVLTNFI